MLCKALKEKYKIDEECVDHKLSAEEKGRKFSIQLPKKSKEKFCRIKVDDCFVNDKSVEKCDYAFHRCSNDEQYYVELKGQKIKKAFDQIAKTISGHLKSPKEKNYGFIVASKVKAPKRNLIVNKMKEEFKKKYGVKLEIGTTHYVHQL
ncbi:MAG: hypothetical protein AAF573_07305 [Bacteroidota bacterium]